MRYDAPQASNFVTFGIGGAAVLVALLFVWAVAHGGGRRAGAVAAVATTGWLGLTYTLASSGLLARFDVRPPPFALMFASILVVGLALGLSPLGKMLSAKLPLAVLVGAQGFRLPLELVMRQAAHEGVMPVAMSFAGYNFDIVTGATALVLAPLIARGLAPRALVMAWNVMGSVMLVVIATVAFMSSPLVRAFGDAPANVNSWVVHPPFVWLPMILVVSAIAAHVMVFRRLLAERSAANHRTEARTAVG